MKYGSILPIFATILFVLGCTPSADQMKTLLKNNPDILTEAIEENPLKFTNSFRKAHQLAQAQAREQQEEEENKRREAEMKNPKEPKVADSRPFRGPKDAPILIVEYSDFQCPYCKRGYQTVEEVLKKYGDKVKFVFKHLPLDFHPMAMPAAQRFEAIALQNKEKALKFHDMVFENQDDLRGDGEKFLDSVAKKVGANVAKMKKDMNSDKVKKQIAEDMEEAKKFGISGTPGFIVAGVTLKGAYPASSFAEIIDARLKQVGAN